MIFTMWECNTVSGCTVLIIFNCMLHRLRVPLFAVVVKSLGGTNTGSVSPTRLLSMPNAVVSECIVWVKRAIIVLCIYQLMST